MNHCAFLKGVQFQFPCCTLVRYQPGPSVSEPLAFPSASQTPPLLHDASDVLAIRGKERKRGREEGREGGRAEDSMEWEMRIQYQGTSWQHIMGFTCPCR